MKRTDFAYSVGAVSCLERKLIPPKLFFDILPLSLEKVFLEIKPYFFGSLEFLQSIEEIEVFLDREKKILDTLIGEWLNKVLLKFFLNFFEYKEVDEDSLRDFPLLSDIFKLKTDFYNIIFSLRADYLNKSFLPKFSGYLSQEELNLLFKQDRLLKIKRQKQFEFFNLASSLKDKEYFLLDFLTIGFLRREVFEFKKVILGPERVFYFYFLKIVQDKISKVILSSKLYNLEEERLKKILEVVYG